MIVIDIPMPKRCADCPCFDDAIYGKCQVKDTWLGAEDSAWFSDTRPNWCPLKEMVTCKDCRHYNIDFCKKRKHETAPDYSCTAGERKDDAGV